MKRNTFSGFDRCLSLIFSFIEYFITFFRDPSSLEITHSSSNACECISSGFFFMVPYSSHKNLIIHPLFKHLSCGFSWPGSKESHTGSFLCVGYICFIEYTHVSFVTTNSGSAGITQIQFLFVLL